MNTTMVLVTNVMWVVVLAFVSRFQFRRGRQEGRFFGYQEGWHAGWDDRDSQLPDLNVE